MMNASVQTVTNATVMRLVVRLDTFWVVTKVTEV